jgi:hypothetical protein
MLALNAPSIYMTVLFGYSDGPLQDAPTNPISGAWAGSIVITDENGVGVQATQEKWEKAQQILANLQESISDLLHRNTLESMRGTLVYVQRMYLAITPYLKGLHLTIDSWREGCNADGWVEDEHVSEDEGDHTPGNASKAAKCVNGSQQGLGSPPDCVQAVPHLAQDIQCLHQLFSSSTPPCILSDPHTFILPYMALEMLLAPGLGAPLDLISTSCFTMGFGVRMMTQAHQIIVNYLVSTLESGVASRYSAHLEIWIFTENFTAESVFYKGHFGSSC